MPRLRNTATGAVISCTDEKAARMGAEWEPIEATTKPAKKTVAKKATTARTRTAD